MVNLGCKKYADGQKIHEKTSFISLGNDHHGYSHLHIYYSKDVNRFVINYTEVEEI